MPSIKKRGASPQWKNVPASLKPLASSVIEAQLPNGLKIRLLPNDAVPTISYYTFFKVGSRNERPGITGISHLFEHMMFNGAKKYGPGQFDRMLESNGGSSNAYTSTDLTVYYEDCMAEALELVIDLEADRMKSLQVTPKMLESERQVVIEERRLRVDNDTLGLMDEELGSTLWKAHPYRWPVIGWMSDIEAITREDCLQYFHTYYAPNNATVFISGDFEPEKTLQLLKKYYGGIKAGPAVPGVIDAEPEQRGERRAQVWHPAQAPSLMVAYRGPKASHPDTLTLDVLQYALAVGQGSRLTKALVFEQEAAVSVSVDWSWRVDPGAFTIHMELKPGADPQKCEEALYRELDKVVKEGLESREVEKACNNLQAQLLRELATNNGRAHALGHYEMMLGTWQEGLALANRYPLITCDDLQKAAAKYLSAHQRSVVTLMPREEAS
ncbi:MAG: insulinase family protein [Myxococcaceae bacterium]|nr:insulinase family protein [Myxococcaceae bacterium]